MLSARRSHQSDGIKGTPVTYVMGGEMHCDYKRASVSGLGGVLECGSEDQAISMADMSFEPCGRLL